MNVFNDRSCSQHCGASRGWHIFCVTALGQEATSHLPLSVVAHKVIIGVLGTEFLTLFHAEAGAEAEWYK